MNKHLDQEYPSRSHFLKQLVLKCVRPIYHLAKPYLRPLALRIIVILSARFKADPEQTQNRPTYLYYPRYAFGSTPSAQENRVPAAGSHQDTEVAAQQGFSAEDIALLAMAARLNQIQQHSYTSGARVAVHSDPGTVLLKTPVGHVLCADSDHAVLECLLDTGDLERGTRLLIERLLAPGDVFVDVGTHLGLLSLAAAQTMKGRGEIFCFEPFPQTRALMEKSIWINGFSDMVRVTAAAVSNRNGNVSLFLGKISGHHSIFPLDSSDKTAVSQIEVPTVTLDSSLPTGQQVTLLKIDAEGAELDIVEGANLLLQNNPHIALIVECGPSHLKRTNHTLEVWLSVFEKLGYVYRSIDINTGILYKVSLAELANAYSTNLLFAKPTSSVWQKLGMKM